jgi:secreted trypsin-like serine protease
MSRTILAAALFALTSTAVAETRFGISSDAPAIEAAPVIGGTAVPLGKWPDAVAVLSAQGSCTGTLIAPDVVLTAGHCADPAPTTVIANTTNYNGVGGIRAAVKSVTAYPNWETTLDIAVIVLQQPIVGVTPRRVGASCTFSGFTENTMVHLVGFGLTDTAGTGNNTELREATAPVLDADCSGGNGCKKVIAPGGEFVAGGTGSADSCFGDSGGPVYLDTPRGTVVIAAVSRGLDNAATPCGGGGIYVRTDKVLAWIEQTAGKPVSKDSCAGGEAPPDGTGEGGGSGSGTGSGTGPGPDYAESADITGGCSAGGAGAGLLGVMMMLGGLRRRRR